MLESGSWETWHLGLGLETRNRQRGGREAAARASQTCGRIVECAHSQPPAGLNALVGCRPAQRVCPHGVPYFIPCVSSGDFCAIIRANTPAPPVPGPESSRA